MGALDPNDKEFIDIVGELADRYQEFAVLAGEELNITRNGHISILELEETREFAENPNLEGIINPVEVYAVLGNGE